MSIDPASLIERYDHEADSNPLAWLLLLAHGDLMDGREKHAQQVISDYENYLEGGKYGNRIQRTMASRTDSKRD